MQDIKQLQKKWQMPQVGLCLCCTGGDMTHDPNKSSKKV